jgi:hypothetical protein
MSCDDSCNDTQFSNKDPSELINLTFNFVPALASDEFIQSITSVTVEVLSGEDPSPNSIVAGTPLINVSGTSVQQPCSGGLVDVGYRIAVLCLTTKGQELVCAGTLTIQKA